MIMGSPPGLPYPHASTSIYQIPNTEQMVYKASTVFCCLLLERGVGIRESKKPGVAAVFGDLSPAL